MNVLLLFFNRVDHFSLVWEQVRQARPDRLFLYQDGPRMEDAHGRAVSRPEDSKDWPGIMACRRLVCDAQIDWPCQVHRLYQERNFGCDPSEYLSQRWAFSQVDRCIVLEDDDVPSQSFFRFCDEMLERYKDDERVTLISGFNTESESAAMSELGDASYFFTRAFSIWGWASWARVVNNWDGDYGFVRDPLRFALLCSKVRQYGQRSDMPAMCQAHAASGKPYYETIFWAYMLLHDGLAVMPRYNLINNVGMDGGTHFSSRLDLLPRRLRAQFTMARHEMCFPLVHPSAVAEWPTYQRLTYLRNAWNNPWRKVQYSLEELWLNLCAGNIRKIGTSIVARVRKTLRFDTYK